MLQRDSVERGLEVHTRHALDITVRLIFLLQLLQCSLKPSSLLLKFFMANTINERINDLGAGKQLCPFRAARPFHDFGSFPHSSFSLVASKRCIGRSTSLKNKSTISP
ncbi:unnamed protein product [Ceratitis capitata]|uniref:(Mediterranean fruit fly) hypothetical protein n=1 Tax=Ceratitis capitata TaxID=7213 RepID=A0A811UKA4_CERCA|nr:unnamed protein product [Ceratitis capitata]